jgi:hypothetical protein
MPKNRAWLHGGFAVVARGLALALLSAAASGADPVAPRQPGASADVPRAAAPDAADLPARPLITLYAYDVHELLDPLFAEVAAETTAIFEEMGVEIEWRKGGLGTIYGGGPSREIPIIVLKEPPGGHRRKSNVLGLVPKGKPAAVWVFVSNVRSALGLAPTDSQPTSMRRLATALGRVVAHEVVHTLAPELPHARDGLMRGTLDARALTSPYLPTPESLRGVVRTALKLAPPSLSGAPRAALPFSPRY